MLIKKLTKNTEEVVKLEVINNNKNTKRFEISEGFYLFTWYCSFFSTYICY